MFGTILTKLREFSGLGFLHGVFKIIEDRFDEMQVKVAAFEARIAVLESLITDIDTEGDVLPAADAEETPAIPEPPALDTPPAPDNGASTDLPAGAPTSEQGLPPAPEDAPAGGPDAPTDQSTSTQ